MEEHKLSAKRPDTGKWWTYGSIKVNQYGNLQAGLRVTPELKALIDANDGKWINFSLFPVGQKADEAKPEQKASTPAPASELLDDILGNDSDIPF